MTFQVLISLLITSVTILIHGFGSIWWLKYLLRRFELTSRAHGLMKSMIILSLTATVLLILHYMEIGIWATVYLYIPHIDTVQSWEEAIYFSSVTYTTTGYGDITLPPVWRIMCGFEAMNGILLFGWSTALFFAVVQKLVLLVNRQN